MKIRYIIILFVIFSLQLVHQQKATAQTQDSFVIGNSCSAYRLVTFPIYENYCFYKEYLADRLVETGYLKEAANLEVHSEYAKDSIILNFDKDGVIAKKEFIGKNFREVASFINGQMVKSVINKKSSDGIDSISIISLYKGKLLIERRKQKKYSMEVELYGKGGNLKSTENYQILEYYKNLTKTNYKGDTIIREWYDYDFNIKKIIKEINGVEVYNEYRGNSPIISKEFINPKTLLKREEEYNTYDHSHFIHLEDVNLFYFDFYTYDKRRIKGYSSGKGLDSRLVIYSENYDSSIVTSNLNDSLYIQSWISNKVVQKKSIVYKDKNLLIRFKNLERTSELLISEIFGFINENFNGVDLLYINETVFYKNNSVKSFCEWNPGINRPKSLIYQFNPNEVGEDKLVNFQFRIKKDLPSCLYGVTQNGIWVISPNYLIIETIDYINYNKGNGVVFICRTKDSTFFINKQGKILISTISVKSYKMITIHYKQRITIKTADSIYLKIYTENSGFNIFTLFGEKVFQYDYSKYKYYGSNSSCILLKDSNSYLVKYYDGSAMSLPLNGDFKLLGEHFGFFTGEEVGVQPRKTLLNISGFKINYWKLFEKDDLHFILAIDGKLVQLDLRTMKVKTIINIENASELVNSGSRYLALKAKGKYGVYDLKRMVFIKKPKYEYIEMANFVFKRDSMWGIFNHDFTKEVSYGFDRIYKSDINKYPYRCVSNNRNYLIDLEGRMAIKSGFDDIVEVDELNIKMYTFDNKILIKESQSLNNNRIIIEELINKKKYWIVKSLISKYGYYGIINDDRIIVPINYYSILPRLAKSNILNKYIKDYSVSFDLTRRDTMFTFDDKNGLVNMNEGFILKEKYKYYTLDHIVDYQVGLRKDSIIENLSCSWNYTFSNGAKHIFIDQDNVWQTNATGGYKTNGTWRLFIGNLNKFLVDSFWSPKDYYKESYIQLKAILNKNRKWIIYDLNWDKIYNKDIDEYRYYEGYVYLRSGSKSYAINVFNPNFKIELRNMDNVVSEYIYEFKKDTIWRRKLNGDLYDFSTNLYINEKVYKGRGEKGWLLDSYLFNLEQIRNIYTSRKKNEMYRTNSSLNYFPPLDFYGEDYENGVVADFYQNSGDDYSDRKVGNLGDFESPLKNIFRNPLTFRLEDLINYPQYAIVDRKLIDDSILNYRLNSLEVKHLFVNMTTNRLYTFDLFSIIDSMKFSNFNNYLFKKLSTYDHIDFPCLPNSDFVSYFNANFTINSKEIILYNRDRDKFTFPVTEIYPFLNQWAKSNMFK